MTYIIGAPFLRAGNLTVLSSGQNSWKSQRFTAPSNFTVSGMFWTATLNYNGSTLIGLQSNNAGNPNGTYLTSGIQTIGSATANQRFYTKFSSNYALTNGTIYHTVIQNGTESGIGSTMKIPFATISGLYQYMSPGSLFYCFADSNLTTLTTTNSGGTWSSASNNPQFDLFLYQSGAVPGSDTGRLGWTGSTQVNTVTGGSQWEGVQIKVDQTYVISGVSINIPASGTRAGSLWCQIEVSGGTRTILGSSFITTPFVGLKSTAQFYQTLPAGSVIYVWFYNPDGFNAAGSQYTLSAINTGNQGGAGHFLGLGSYVSIASVDSGTTVTSNTNYKIFGLIASGAAGLPAGDPNIRYSDNFITIIS